jgi:signal transduction histidine kinase
MSSHDDSAFASVAGSPELSLPQALDAERKRISSELHDRTGPNLAAIAINLRTIANRLAGLPNAELSLLLSDCQALLAETIAEIRDLSAELRPARLEYSGLVPTLTDRIEQFRRRTGMEVDWNVQFAQGNGADVRLDADTEWMLFRVAQEAMTNCAKHAKASRLQIDLIQSPAMIELRFRDNGTGFDPQGLGQAGPAIGMGLLTMRERVEQAGGVFALQSEPGNGTRIRVNLPLLAPSPKTSN